MAKPIRTLELHYPMIQFLIMSITRPCSQWNLQFFATLANELLIHIKHYKQLNKMNFEKLLAGQVFKNKISVGFIIIFFKIVHLRLLLYTLCCIYLLLLLIGCFYFLTPINFVTQPRYSQRSRKKCHEKWSHWRIKNRRIMSTFLTICVTQNACLKLWKGVAL